MRRRASYAILGSAPLAASHLPKAYTRMTRSTEPRRLTVPPGAYGLRDGEEKLITDGWGDPLLVKADKSVVISRGRRGRPKKKQ
jgi:hypothetical protein